VDVRPPPDPFQRATDSPDHHLTVTGPAGAAGRLPPARALPEGLARELPPSWAALP